MLFRVTAAGTGLYINYRTNILKPEITGKHSEKFLKNAENKNLLKSKEY